VGQVTECRLPPPLVRHTAPPQNIGHVRLLIFVADISLPEGVQAPDEEGEDAGDESQNRFNEPEKWKELGLTTVR